MTDRWRRPVLAVAGAVCLFAALAAPLPGELRGCGGDMSGAMDVSTYCFERCDVEAQKSRECGLIDDTDEAEIADAESCASSRSCTSPTLCSTQPDYHISKKEANDCTDAILDMGCDVFEAWQQDPPAANPPRPCFTEEICDPL